MRGVRASSLSAYLPCLSVSSKPNPPLFLYPFVHPSMLPSFSCSARASPRWYWLFSVFACRRECLNWRRLFQFVKGMMWFLKDELGMMLWKTFGTFATDFFFILLKSGKYRMMRTIDDCWWLQIGNLIVSIYRKTIYDLFFCLHFYTNNVFSLCLFYFNFCYILNLFVHFEQLCLHFQFVWPSLFTSSTCLLYAFWAVLFSILICLLSFYPKWC